MFGRDARRTGAILFVAAWAAGCGGSDAPAQIVARWRYDLGRRAAPPGIGPERRVAVAAEDGPGAVLTLNEQNGTRLEGPFDAFPSAHAPVFTGTTLVVVSTIGKVVGYSLAGETRFSAPDAPLGVTTPLAVAPDGSLRIGSTSGRVVALAADGSTRFDVSIGGAVTSPLALGADGTTFAATDTGHVVALDAAGATKLDLTVSAPASGPSLGPGGRIAVGEQSGVRVFDASGAELFRRPRPARVVGTRFLASGALVAWGEDGAVELYGEGGELRGRYEAGPPIYANVVPVAGDRLAVFDSEGTVHRLGPSAELQVKLELGAVPLPEVAVGELGFAMVAIGTELRAYDFTF